MSSRPCWGLRPRWPGWCCGGIARPGPARGRRPPDPPPRAGPAPRRPGGGGAGRSRRRRAGRAAGRRRWRRALRRRRRGRSREWAFRRVRRTARRVASPSTEGDAALACQGGESWPRSLARCRRNSMARPFSACAMTVMPGAVASSMAVSNWVSSQ
ncbi:hypothetical protein EQK42_07465 [Streptomyces albidoflavus]|nr:hypothetical protein EQK42_07465 [Streptomyces albidoflavus]